MQLGEVIGHATSTVKHPTLRGWRLAIVQPLDARQRPDGVPILVVDSLGGSNGDRVIISSDGKAVRELIGAENSPARWMVIGLADGETRRRREIMTNAAEMVDRIVAGVLEQLQAPAAAALRVGPHPRPRTGRWKFATPSLPAVCSRRGASSRAGGVCREGDSHSVGGRLPVGSQDQSGRKRTAPLIANTTSTTWTVLLSRSTPAVEAALDAVTRPPGVQWHRELVGCHREAARRAVGALCRGECEGVIAFTGKPEALACHANRNAQVRASAVAETAERVKRRQADGGGQPVRGRSGGAIGLRVAGTVARNRFGGEAGRAG